MSNPEDPGHSGTSSPVLAAPAQILATFSRARPATVTEAAGSAARGQVVKLAGKAVPGAGGPLRAPLSGAECVWYRSIVFRALRESGYTRYQQRPLQPMNPLAPSDLPDYGATHRVNMRGQQLGSDTSSTAPFALTDGGAEVVIDPRITDVDTDVFGVNQVVKSSRAGGPFAADEVHTEWIIPVGADLLAVGTVRLDGADGADGTAGTGVAELVAQGDDIVLVSTKPEQQILSRNATATEVHLPVSSPRSAVVLLGGLLAVAAVAAVVVFFILSH